MAERDAPSPVDLRVGGGQWQRVVDLLPDAAVVLDAATTVVAANGAAATLAGRRRGALRGVACARALDVRDRTGAPAWAEGWPSATGLRSVRALSPQEVTVRRPDGTEVTVVVAGTYLRAPDGALEGAVLTLRPTGRRHTASLSAIEVVSTVSHELRSPLTSVKGYTSLVLNRWDRLGEDQKRMMLRQVNHDADRVVRLISELLDISRLETGRLVLRRQLVDLARLAATVVAKVGAEYPDLGATIDVDPDVPAVWADPDKVEQVLTNLVENACKYADPRGLVITATRVDHDDRHRLVAVVVTDRGLGIPAEDLPKVFTMFYRRAEGRPTGSGLGLWISRGLVEAHGGRLSAESPPGHGASFRFTLPLVDLEKLQS